MPLLGRQRGGEQARVFAFEDVLVVENERLVEFDQFFRADQLALRSGEWRFFHTERDRHSIDTGDDGLLPRNRKLLVALLRHGNRFELHFQPAIDTLRRSIVLAMSKPGEFDAAAHVHRIDRRSRELVHPGVAPRNDAGGNKCHPAANHVHGNYIEALPLVRRELAEICAKQIRKRPRGIDAFVPPGKRRALRAFHNRRAHDGDRQIASPPRKNRLTKAFCERIRIGPAEMLRAAHPHAYEPVANPACAIAFQDAVEFRHGRCSFVAAASQRLAAKRLGKFGAPGARFDVADRLAQRFDFMLRIELGIARGIVIFLKFLGDVAVSHAGNVAGRKMHQPGVIGFSQEVQQVERRIHIGRNRVAQIRIEIRQTCAVHDEVERFRKSRLHCLIEP